MHDDYRHPVETIARLAGGVAPAPRDLLQLGYNLGRLSEQTGLGREPFWDRWKDAVASWDRAALDRLVARLREDAAAWPAGLVPALEVVGETQAPERSLGCNTVRPDELATCSFGPLDAPRTAVVVGDSISLSWLAGLRAALEPQGWRLTALTRDGCPVVDADVGEDPALVVARAGLHGIQGRTLPAPGVAAGRVTGEERPDQPVDERGPG